MMNRLSKPLCLLLAAVFVSGMVLAPGCEKKKPPPPPPPPVEPPPPPEVSFDSIMQTLKSDARVSAAGSMGVTDESFAKAAVQLADSFARGDAEKLKGLLTSRAKGVVEGLEADGQWQTLTKRVEAVRIVYAGSAGSVGDLEREQGLKQMRELKPMQKKAYEDILLKRGLDKNEQARFLEQWDLEWERNFVRVQNDRSAGENAGGGTPDPASSGGEMALLIAVQTPDGADLLGWSARKGGDAWVFNNASTLSGSRPRARDWDGVGMFGFSLETGSVAVAPRVSQRRDEEKKPESGPGAGSSDLPVKPEEMRPVERNPSVPDRPTRDPRRPSPGGN